MFFINELESHFLSMFRKNSLKIQKSNIYTICGKQGGSDKNFETVLFKVKKA